MTKYLKYIFFIVAVFLFFIPPALAWDFSTPAATITTLETEFYKKNFDLYNNATYYSPQFIADIPKLFGMNYEDFRLCLDKAVIYYSSLIRGNYNTSDLKLGRMEITKEEPIDENHTHILYQDIFSSKDDYTGQPLAPNEDDAYLIKFDNEWWIDLAPEIKDEMARYTVTSVCPAELKRAVELERKTGLNFLEGSEKPWASLAYNGYRVNVSLVGPNEDVGIPSDFDQLYIGTIGDDEDLISYQFYVYEMMANRNFDDPAILPDLKKRLDYVTTVAKIIDTLAPKKYFSVGGGSDYQYLTIEVKDINSNLLTIDTQREYEPGDTRYEDHPVYRNINPVRVKINLSDRTLTEESLIEQEKQADKKFDQWKREKAAYTFLNYFKNYWINLSILFLSTALLMYLLIIALAGKIRFKPDTKLKAAVVSSASAILIILLIALKSPLIFISLFSEPMVGTFGLLGGLLFGPFLIGIGGCVICLLMVLFLAKYWMHFELGRAILTALLCGILLYIAVFLLQFIGIYKL